VLLTEDHIAVGTVERPPSGDAALDSLGSSVSDVLRTELGQSSHVMTVPSNRVLQVLQDLRIQPNTTPAPTELARVADFTNARSVLWGQLTRFGEAIRIDATLQDLDKGQTVPLNAMAPNARDLLASIGLLADAVRENLAHGSTDILTELKSTSWKPSTSSFEALRLYNEGQLLTQQGNHQAALKSFEAATKIDDHFALALSAMAKSYSTLGYDTEAGQFSRRAMSLSESLPPQEKYRIAANHYRILNNTQKAIESYENLAKSSPGDATIPDSAAPRSTLEWLHPLPISPPALTTALTPAKDWSERDTPRAQTRQEAENFDRRPPSRSQLAGKLIVDKQT
jgi:tetratricopeptide (TPR) repeat protein